jgi:hypothetical protein
VKPTASSPVVSFNWDELNKKPMLDRYESAFYVRLSQRAFDERIGTLFPHIKVGRRTFFMRSSLLAALTKLERKASK